MKKINKCNQYEIARQNQKKKTKQNTDSNKYTEK